MKEGLRKQFRLVMENPNIEYFGNVTVGNHGDLTLDDLRALGFDTILITAGAQGTKWLGLPGEHLKGVYHAKDVVYFYNKLRPFPQKASLFGKRCAVVGEEMWDGDVFRLSDRDEVEEVIAIARRGPVEVKFDKNRRSTSSPTWM